MGRENSNTLDPYVNHYKTYVQKRSNGKNMWYLEWRKLVNLLCWLLTYQAPDQELPLNGNHWHFFAHLKKCYYFKKHQDTPSMLCEFPEREAYLERCWTTKSESWLQRAENTKTVGTEGIPHVPIWLSSSRKGVTSKNRTNGTILWLWGFRWVAFLCLALTL